MKILKPKFKGRKLYAVARNERGSNLICGDTDIERVVRALDKDYPILVECTVTRVFTRERELKEIEIEL